MSTLGVRYSPELKKKVMDLSDSTNLTAEEIAEKLQGLKRFKDEARLMTPGSIYSIRQRYVEIDVAPSPKPADTGGSVPVSRPLADECLVSNHGEQTTLTISVPTSKVGLVLKRLGY
jgi:hypothetical protein